MTQRTYGQYCGFARALELLGERWTLMILRDLFVSPKRFSELQRGLPGISTNVLTSRLKELEAAGIVQRRLLGYPNSMVYELTRTGAALEPTIVELGRWGVKLLGQPRSHDVITVDSLVVALRSTFQRQAAKGLTASYELRVGDVVLHARIERGRLTVEPGPLSDADLTIETGAALRDLLTGELSPTQAVQEGLVRTRGKQVYLDRFVEIFHI